MDRAVFLNTGMKELLLLCHRPGETVPHINVRHDSCHLNSYLVADRLFLHLAPFTLSEPQGESRRGWGWGTGTGGGRDGGRQHLQMRKLQLSIMQTAIHIVQSQSNPTAQEGWTDTCAQIRNHLEERRG